MKRRLLFVFLCLLLAGNYCIAQKPITEGSVTYRVLLMTADNKPFTGTYTFYFKGGLIRKELKLANGFQDILIINTDKNTAYTLQTRNSWKFAIQLNMDELLERQKKYEGFTLSSDKTMGKIIAGYTAFKGVVKYNDGTQCDIYYTPEWCPEKGLTYERFPMAKFIPLSYMYKEDNNITMQMEVEKMTVGPVENALFRIPANYKIISNKEYKQLSR